MKLPTTLLMFVAGIVKYTERVSSLFRGRLLTFSRRPLELDVGRRYRRDREKTEAELVRDAYSLFTVFKSLYTGLHQSLEHPSRSNYLLDCTPEEVFRVLGIQFNFAYEALYTKTALIWAKSRWKDIRLAVTVLQVGCLVIWLFFIDKGGFKERNIRVTNTLLVGAIAVDVLAFLRIHLFSDWAISHRRSNNIRDQLLSWFQDTILSARKRTWAGYRRREDAPFSACFRRALFRRWSESIPQLSLVSIFFDDKPSNKVFGFLGGDKGIEQRKYLSTRWFSSHLRDFLYEDIAYKKDESSAVENIGKVKGGWACFDLISKYQADIINIPTICELLDAHGEYYAVLMQWHIITEICYQGNPHDWSRSNDAVDDNLVKRLLNKLLQKGNSNNATNTAGSGNKINLEDKECNYKEICKTLSDYLMYLLIHRQDMLSPPGIANLKLNETCKFVKKGLSKYMGSEAFRNAHAERKRAGPYLACPFISETVEENAFGHQLLLNFPIAGILGELEELEKKQIGKWKFMAKVWSELLYYAAIQCKPILHASNLKQGGELLSFVWLFLVEMGFGNYQRKPKSTLLHTY